MGRTRASPKKHSELGVVSLPPAPEAREGGWRDGQRETLTVEEDQRESPGYEEGGATQQRREADSKGQGEGEEPVKGGCVALRYRVLPSTQHSTSSCVSVRAESREGQEKRVANRAAWSTALKQGLGMRTGTQTHDKHTDAFTA